MPSTYAHYRIGQEVIHKLPANIQKIITHSKELYDIGLHGPDILFYYHPLKMNSINSIGYRLHDEPGFIFFENAKEIIEQNFQDEKYLAYIFGFICHYVLDATCHKYIDEKINISGISHTEIEVEFDRYLMLLDHHDPIRHHLTHHIISNNDYAKIISPFFYKTDAHHIKKALQSMKTYNDLLIAPSRIKRTMIYSLLKVTGNYKEMHGLLVNIHENPECKDSTKK